MKDLSLKTTKPKMLMKRKKPQKKVVVKKTEWIENPIEQEVQEGKIDKVVFTAKLSEKEKRGKWYLMNHVSIYYVNNLMCHITCMCVFPLLQDASCKRGFLHTIVSKAV